MRRLLLLGALALSACRQHVVETPQVLRVLVAADARFRERSHWREVINSRIHNVSALYDSAALEVKRKGAPGSGRESPEKPTPQSKPRPVPR